MRAVIDFDKLATNGRNYDKELRSHIQGLAIITEQIVQLVSVKMWTGRSRASIRHHVSVWIRIPCETTGEIVSVTSGSGSALAGSFAGWAPGLALVDALDSAGVRLYYSEDPTDVVTSLGVSEVDTAIAAIGEALGVKLSVF